MSWPHSHTVATHYVLQVVVDPHMHGGGCRGGNSGKASCLVMVGVLQ